MLRKDEIQNKKRLDVFLPLVSPISGLQIGSLVALTIDDLSTNFCTKYFNWREHSADMFLTKFNNSPEKVKDWFQNKVIPDKSRGVFLIKDICGIAIGVCGFCNFKKNEVELDTMIRGESSGSPDLMWVAQRALIWWILNNSQVVRISGRVLSRNIIVRHFHKQFGFLEYGRKPLKLRVNDEGSEYVLSNDYENMDEELIEITLSRDDYRSNVRPYLWPKT